MVLRGPAAVILAIAALSQVAAAGPDVVPVDGARYEAALGGITPAGHVIFSVGKTPRSLPLADLVSWGALVEPARGLEVLLADGGSIIAETARADDEKLSLESALLGKRDVPLELVAGIVFQPPHDAQQRDRLLNRVRAGDIRADRLLLENGDELRGTIGAITGGDVEIESQGQKLTVAIPRIAAAAFDPTLAADTRSEIAGTLVGLRDGSRLIARSLTADAHEAQLTLAGGATWNLPTESIVFLQPRAARAKYLSDMTAESYRHLPYLTTEWDYHKDSNVVGTQLRAAGHPYAKGLGMHSAGRLTYRLGKHYRTFEADVALDDHVGRGGSVVFAVYVDDKLAYKSDVIRGGGAPVPVKVDVAAATRLSLLVEFAERGDELDRADWLNARVVE